MRTEQESLGLGVAVGRGNRVLRVQVASAVPCRTPSPLPWVYCLHFYQQSHLCSTASGGSSLIRADPVTGVASDFEVDTFSVLFLNGLFLEVK